MMNTANSTELKEYLKQEGISHDDVINSEIEQEHKEKELRKNIVIKEVSKEEQKAFEEDLKNKNLLPIEAVLTFRMIDFIDITSLNSQSIPFENYEKIKKDFVEKNKKLTIELINKIKSELTETGMRVVSVAASGKEYEPFKFDLSKLLKKVFADDILPPPRTTINPKLASSFAC